MLVASILLPFLKASRLKGAAVAGEFAQGVKGGGATVTAAAERKVIIETERQVVKPVKRASSIVFNNGVDLDDVVSKIGGGHAFEKHALEFGVTSKNELSNIVKTMIKEADDYKALDRGRHAWWHEKTQSVVIYDPNHVDLGTVVKPKAGKKYFSGDKLE